MVSKPSKDTKSTTKESEEPITFYELFERDALRLRNKGTMGLVVSASLALALLFAVEMFGK